ncbi:MAG TPA: helix-turn-helix domain-containing protein [Bacteroidales bacterium]|nr:helix-turn-helix domain-containing protein [Bacteroidales bacterium]
MEEIGKIIQYHRKKSNLTQKELALLAGVGKTVVFDIEHGKETVQFVTLKNVCDVLSITIGLESPLMKQYEQEKRGEKS